MYPKVKLKDNFFTHETFYLKHHLPIFLPPFILLYTSSYNSTWLRSSSGVINARENLMSRSALSLSFSCFPSVLFLDSNFQEEIHTISISFSQPEPFPFSLTFWMKFNKEPAAQTTTTTVAADQALPIFFLYYSSIFI